MYRFVWRPRWLLGHIVVLALVVLMVNLGFWQLRRLEDRRTLNATVAARSQEPAVAIDATDLDPGVRDPDAIAAAEWQRVEALGTYVTEDEVLIRSRSLGGRPGFHVVTPLLLDDGTAVAVSRGWVPLEVGEQVPVTDARPPAGTVRVEGVLRVSQERGGFGPTDPEEGRRSALARTDVERLAGQTRHPLRPMWIQLLDQQPPPGDLPIPLGLPEPDEGPHLAYAGQWFIFSLIALGGWPLLIRQSARARAVSEAPASSGG